jgi:histone deacetylase 1/2
MQKADPVVAYFYDEELCNYNYGGGNPMRPHRVRLTHNLVHNYNLDKKLWVRRPEPRTEEQISMFHADGRWRFAAWAPRQPARAARAAPRPATPPAADYVEFLKNVTPDNQDEYMQQLRRFNMGAPGEADCPVFDGVFEYCAVRAAPGGRDRSLRRSAGR